jgi:hypothetical protein
MESWKRLYSTGSRLAPSAVQIFIDHVSLVKWKIKFNNSIDLSTLGYYTNGERKTMWVSHLLGGRKAFDVSATSAIRNTMPIVWAFGNKQGINDNGNSKVVIPYKSIDVEAMSKIEDVTAYRIFTLPGRDDVQNNNAKAAAYKAVDYIMFKLTGLVGTTQAIRNVV